MTGSDPTSREAALLRTITAAQSQILLHVRSQDLFRDLLNELLRVTESEYGLIGEVVHDPVGGVVVEMRAITNIGWSQEATRLYEKASKEGLRFKRLDSLYGAVIQTGEPVVSNDPAHDPRACGIPHGHPELRSFLGMPFRDDQGIIGIMGVANRPGGYDEALVRSLEPLVQTCAYAIVHYRSEERRAAAEKAKSEKEALVRAILDSLLEGVICIDSQGTIESVNPAAERIFGYHADELVGGGVDRLTPEPIRGNHPQYIRRYIETGVPRLIGTRREVEAVRKNGQRFPIELAIAEMRMTDGVRFVGIVRDITERKHVSDQLRKSRDDVMSVLNLLPFGTMVVEQDGRIAFLSDTCRNIEGIDPERDLGKQWRDLLRVDAASAADFDRSLTERSDARLPIRWRTPDGRLLHLEVEEQRDPRDRTRRFFFVHDVTETQHLRSELSHVRNGIIVGGSEAIRHAYAMAEAVAAGDWTVLIEGETGVGKDLVARAIHSASERRDGPFVAVNCAALSESLLASQLFGHRRGAFTGAINDQEGVFEAASRGTIFLDEIGDISLGLQSSLLRVLQEKEITRVGETRPRKVNVRVIAATHRDLVAKVREGTFREDLLYRVRVARIQVPALRERLEDIPDLVDAFLAEQRKVSPKKIDKVSAGAMARLLAHPWPGNIRELKSAIDFAFIMGRERTIGVDDLPPELHGSGAERIQNAPPLAAQGGTSAKPSLDGLPDRERVLAALRLAKGNRTLAAKILGIGRATLYRRLAEMRIGAESQD